LLLRIVVEGRRREVVLGDGAVVELAEAPERIRRLARFAGDTIAERQLAEVGTPTFREVAERWRAETAPTWRNKVHAAQWLSSLAAYAFPFFGDRAIDTIGRSDIVKVLAPIWMTKPETARRVRQRIRKILEWARFKYELAGTNPVDGVVHALPRQPRRCGHFAALPYSDIPAFWTQLEGLQGEEPRASIQALQLVVLTACRSHEVRLAKKEEFDLAAQIWTIPRERMKADAAHVVPLSPRGWRSCGALMQQRAMIASCSLADNRERRSPTWRC
jgi:integrase